MPPPPPVLTDSSTQACIMKAGTFCRLNKKVSQQAGTKPVPGDRLHVNRWWVALKAGSCALSGYSRVCRTGVWIFWSFKIHLFLSWMGYLAYCLRHISATSSSPKKEIPPCVISETICCRRKHCIRSKKAWVPISGLTPTSCV